MRKFLIAALLFLASALSFGQDGRTKINYYNHTRVTLRMLINGNAACTGDVMPGGMCTEPVNPGTYHIGATNGQQTTDRVISLEDGGTFDYTLYEENAAAPVPPGLKLTAQVQSVSLLNYGPFNVDAPVTLTRGDTQNAKTEEGRDYTSTMWSGSLPNEDTYMVGVANYPFALTTEDLGRAVKGFVGSVDDGKILKQDNVTISGQPATAVVVDGKYQGRAIRYAFVVTTKGSTAYIFVFGTWLDVTNTDMVAVKQFFTSATLN